MQPPSTDKMLHFVGGMILYILAAAVTYFCFPTMSPIVEAAIPFSVVVVVGIAREAYLVQHHAEPLPRVPDALALVLGAFILSFFQVVLGLST
jgi:hypothetical protein